MNKDNEIYFPDVQTLLRAIYEPSNDLHRWESLIKLSGKKVVYIDFTKNMVILE